MTGQVVTSVIEVRHYRTGGESVIEVRDDRTGGDLCYRSKR